MESKDIYVRGSWFDAKNSEREFLLKSLLDNPIDFLIRNYSKEDKDKIVQIISLYSTK